MHSFLSSWPIQDEWGKKALQRFSNSITKNDSSFIPEPFKGFFSLTLQHLNSVDIDVNKFVDTATDKNMPRFLNRLLGLGPDIQNEIFEYYAKIYRKVVEEAKKEGKYDTGLQEVRGTSITLMSSENVSQSRGRWSPVGQLREPNRWHDAHTYIHTCIFRSLNRRKVFRCSCP